MASLGRVASYATHRAAQRVRKRHQFCHFCDTVLQAGTTALAVLKYRKGVSEQFASGYEPDMLGGAPAGAGGQPAYPQYPAPGSDVGPGGDPYHQPPFSGHDPSRPGGGDFHPVTY